MKRLLHGSVISLSVITGPALAETVTYACQYNGAVGFVWSEDRWVTQEFTPPKPFFLFAKDGSLKPEDGGIPSLEYPWPYLPFCSEPEELMTSPDMEPQTGQACSTIGGSFNFNFDSLSGVQTRTWGAVMPPGPDEVPLEETVIATMPFSCEIVPQ